MKNYNFKFKPVQSHVKEMTEDNQWFIEMAKELSHHYNEGTARTLIKQIADDCFYFGYQEAKEYWRHFYDNRS